MAFYIGHGEVKIVYIKRAIESTVEKISNMFGVLLVTGPRQVGKTTTLQKLGAARKYVTFDDPEIRFIAKNDPAFFVQRYTPPIIIDEIQYAPEILPYIKMRADSTKVKGGYWLTGSQVFHTMKNVSESLAGRVGIIKMLGLSTNEINGIESSPFIPSDSENIVLRVEKAKPMSLVELYSRIFNGSMPAMYANSEDAAKMDWENFYSSYVGTYLQRDIKDITQVADEMSFFNFMTVVAARTAKPVIYDEMAKECGISSPTAKKWLSILVSSGVVALVQPYHNNILKRVVKAPLLHFLDTGLCAYLLRWNNPETLERGAMSGAFFESYVFSEIYKSWIFAGKEPPIYYYRDKDRKEIDLLIERDGELHPVEIKKSASPSKGDLKHFRLLKDVRVGNGALICMTKEALPMDEKNWSIPAWGV